MIIKLYLRHPLHAKSYIFLDHSPKLTIGYLGSSNLIVVGVFQQEKLNVDDTSELLVLPPDVTSHS